MAAPTINGSQSISADTVGVDPKTISLATQSYTAGNYALFFYGLSQATVTSATGATDDTYAELNEFSDGLISLAIHEGTINGGALDASIALDISSARRGSGGLITISGAADNASQPHVLGANTTGTSNDPSASGITTTVNDCLVFAIISMAGSHVLATLDAALPAGWTLLGSWRTDGDSPANGAHQTISVAYKTQATAGATGAATWTNGMGASEAWCGNQIAIAPAAAAAASLVHPARSPGIMSLITR